MDALADALVFAAVYLGASAADDEHEDADCSALEGIGAILTKASVQERKALHEAVGASRLSRTCFFYSAEE